MFLALPIAPDSGLTQTSGSGSHSYIVAFPKASCLKEGAFGGSGQSPALLPDLSGLLARLVAPFFVLIWATGFIAARLVAPHVQPLSFLCLRYVVASGVLAAMALVSGARWPSGRGWRDTALAGLLIQAGYLGGVFWAVRHGLPAGLSALIVGLQPLLTAALAWRLLGERVGARRWAGIAVGFAGAALVVAPVLLSSVQPSGRAVSPAAVAVCLGAMVSITLGTIWQKRTGGVGDLRTALAVQYAASLAVTAPVALLLEGGAVGFDGSWQAWAGLLWASLGLSVGAVSLLMVLIRRGAVAGVATLLYLVPPVSEELPPG